MKILFIITQSEIGGAQRFLLEFVPYLANKGHEIAVVAGEGNGELFGQYQILGSKSKKYFIKNLVRNLNPIKDIAALLEILKIIKKEQPDILFLQSTKAGFLGSIAGKLSHKKVVYRIGGWSFQDPRPWWANKIIFWMEKISAPLKDSIIVNSELDRQLAIDKKIVLPNKVIKIHNGINPDALNFLSKEEARKVIVSSIKYPVSSSKKKILVGTIANLYATKGIEHLIEAAHHLYQILDTRYQILFIVIGEGKERPRLEALIKKYNLQDKFFLVGRIANASKYLKAFDAFVLPSVKEGFPWVMLEAMAAEVPVIATKVGAVPEIIENEKNGLLVPPKNSEALAESIKRIFESQALSQEIIGGASERLKYFSLKKMLEDSENIINDQ